MKSTLSARRMMPALFTSTSTARPSKTSRAAIGSAKSSLRSSALSIRSAVAAQDERPAQITCAPACPIATAMASPMPVFAPVTSAVRPAREERAQRSASIGTMSMSAKSTLSPAIAQQNV